MSFTTNIDADNAAHSLEGVTLTTGWIVKEKISKGPNQSGANFSVGYIVNKDGKDCFMKAYDFAGFLAASPARANGGNTMDILQEMTVAYKYEKDLSEHCKNKHVTKVSFVTEHGEEIRNGFSIPMVPYLIFELADGDIRATIDFSDKLNYAWRLKSLHDIAVGLKQLHAIDVSHQDLKPSNILVFNEESKLCDLGRSVCNDIDGPYSKWCFSGDNTYAPPEIWYGYYDSDWKRRSFAADCFMLGSLISFYFSGLPMSTLLSNHIPRSYHWTNWNGEYSEIVPYLEDAFSRALLDFDLSVNSLEINKELRQLVEQLCNPIIEKRGHPRNISSRGNSYNLERFISKLDLLRLKLEISIKKGS